MKLIQNVESITYQALFQVVDVALCASAKHSLEDRPNFCNRPYLGRAIRWPEVGRNQIRCGQAQILDCGTCATNFCAVR